MQMIDAAPMWLIALVFAGTILLASLGGSLLRSLWSRRVGSSAGDEQESYVVSAVLGLLALLLAFTFSVAMDRYESRRALVLQETNAVGTAYLRAQLLDEPYRSQMSGLLRDYVDNRLALAVAARPEVPSLLARDDRIIINIWRTTVAAHPSFRTAPFAIPLITSINELIDLNNARKVARQARVPGAVFIGLFAHTLIAMSVLGFVLTGTRSRLCGALLFVILFVTLLLIVDLDRPLSGLIQESQRPMQELKSFLAKNPPASFTTSTGAPGLPAP